MLREITLKNGIVAYIRPSKIDDSQKLIYFMQQVSGETDFLTTYPDEINASVVQKSRQIHGFSNTFNTLHLVCDVNNQIVATASLHGGKSRRTAHIATFGISILRDYWGLGIASGMMDVLFNWAQNIGIKKINLEVRIDNLRAIKLYSKYGFKVIGVNTRGFMIDGKFIDILYMGYEM